MQTHSSNAPLAFSLSVHSEAALRTLHGNAITRAQQLVSVALCTLGSAVACTGLLYLWLPLWLCMPLAGVAAWQCFGFARDYFEGGHVNGRVQSNRNMLLKAIDTQDAARFAEITAMIVQARYATRQWAPAVGTLREQPGADPYLYLATVFGFAPECWHLAARQVYERLLAEVGPAA